MRNILSIDIRTNPYSYGYTNEASNNNIIELNFTNDLVLSNSYIEITKTDGSIVNVGLEETIDFSIFQNAGTIKVRLIADDFTSEYININVNENLETTDNAIVKIKDEEYIVKKVKPGSGGGTHNHADLENLDYASSGHTGFASSSELYVYGEKVDQLEKNFKEEIEKATTTAEKVYFEDGETLAEKVENGEVNTTAENVYFDDGESLAEKYNNGELGSGGGSSDDEIILTYITNSSINIAAGGVATIQYGFAREIYTSRSGAEKVYVDGTLTSTRSISQGPNTVNISNLAKGTHSITIEVSSSGLTSSLVYSIEVIELSISSTFDGFSIYGSDITYRYTPVGNIEKTIYFIIDNEEYGTATVTESGKTMTYDFVGLSHGSHSLKVYMTADLGGSLITSNELIYDLVVNSGGTDIIIGCPFNITQATQGDLLTFEYLVCNPSSLTSEVTLKINDEVVNSLTVDRTKQTWALRDYPTGAVTFTIQSGDTSVSFEVDVEALEINVTPITHNLELYLTANGRNNTEAEDVRNRWSNNGYSATFSNFNWTSNGWVKDENQDSVLRVNGDATVTIPIKLFAKDFRSTGKTIEFEFSTHDVRNYESVLINCMSNNRGFELTSNIARLKAEQSSVETKFKEDEKVRIAFVIEPTSENRLIYTYINGIQSGLVQYPSDEDFSQSTPIGITIGSPNATIDIYNIRVYNIDLDHSDILTNYIADTNDGAMKLDLYSSNNIFDSYGNISYDKVLERIPCLTIIGELPGSKGDKKTVVIKYVNLEDSSKNFTASSAILDIQGTSSQYYPRKNYKFKLVVAYKLTDNSIEEYVFCLKADYMESSHSHNTGLAKIVNKLYPTTPAKEQNEQVQAAITGFPIVVWHKANETAEPECLGVYNFNNDKDDTTTWGYTEDFPQCESWEFKNNTSAHCLFQSDNFVDTVEVAKNFEARYPEDYTDYTALSRVVSWVYSTQNDLDKFKNEFDSYFNLEATLLYYCLTELFAMVDSRAKNLFLTTWDGLIWYPTFYDMDTAFGLNNEGVNSFDYSVEYHDVQGTQNVFNGESSVLWNNFEQAFADEIAEFYIELRNNDKVTYNSVMEVLYGEQISKIPENIYNYDGIEKYKNPLVEDNIGTYLYAGQGSRLESLKRWLHNRFPYTDSKYLASDFKEDYMTLRIYTPTNYGSVEPNADAHITPYTDQYVVVKYDENEFSERGRHNEETVIDAPNQIFNDTPMIIYGASGISSIGDLSPLYPGTVDVSSGIKLKELIIGNSAEDYTNTNLAHLTLGNNELLIKLDVRNCPSLTEAIDASGCTNIEEIYATGTSTTAVKLPNGGNLKKLHLPSTVSNITILNQPFISEFVCEGYDNVNTIRVENSSADSLTMVQESINENLTRVRLINIDWEIDNTLLLDQLMLCGGLDENGINQDKAVITGTIHIKGSISTDELEEYLSYWSTGLIITADTVVTKFKCYFYNYDGTLLFKTSVVEGGNAVYGGETPTKPNDETYSYDFSGWTPNIETTSIYADTEFTAYFTSTKLLVVNWVNYDGTILQTDKVKSGETVSYIGETPTRPNDVQYKNYLLTGWLGSDETTYSLGSTITITSDYTLTTQYTGTLQSYSCYWYNGDTLLQTTVGVYGSTAEYSGSTPIHEDGYMFLGWSTSQNSSVANADLTITGDMYFYAAFEKPDMLEIEVIKAVTPSYTLASCTGTSEEVTIDWGDGDVTTYTITTSGTVCAKPNAYALGEYTIKLPANENYKITAFSPGNTSFYQSIRYKTATFSYLRINCTYFFYYQSQLTNVNLGLYSEKIGEKYIEQRMFWGCTNLTSITIPNGVILIGPYAIRECTNLTSVELPSSLQIINTNAFYGCTSLTSIEIPSSVTSIETSVFGNCSSLINLNVDENNTVYKSVDGDLYSKNGEILYWYAIGKKETSIVISPNVTNIYSYAFNKYAYLTNIELPSGLKSIGSYAFEGCTDLTSIEIPSGVTAINPYTFYQCSNLTSVKLSPNITTLNNYAFGSCGKLTSIDLPDSLISIGQSTFRACGNLTSIKIPSKVSYINNDAFANCGKLTSIEIPSSVTSIGSTPFKYCSGLEEIIWNFPTTSISLKDGLFGSALNTSVKKLTLNNDTTSKLNYVCRCMNGLEELVVNGSFSGTAAQYAYSQCGLPNDQYYLPSTLTDMTNAFRQNTVVTTVTIPSSVTNLYYCFYGATALEEITIPSLVTNMSSTFQNCSKLTKVKMLPTTPPTITTYTFSGCTVLTTIEVPKGYLETYQTASNWSSYASKMVEAEE